MDAEDTTKLLNAVGEFTSNLREKERTPGAGRELNKFVNHFQGSTLLTSITPSQIGTYATMVGKNGSSDETLEGLQVVRKFLAFAFKSEKTEMNLATHFRIRKTKTSNASNNDFVSSVNNQDMTKEGYDQLVDEKETLETNRSTLSDTIQKAAADGDVRENAPLESAREQQGREEARIKEIELMLRSATVVDGSGKGSKKARVGVMIQVEDVDRKKKIKYTLVSPSEANPNEGKISDASPLGKAFLGKRVGQKAIAETPKGKTTFRIVSIY